MWLRANIVLAIAVVLAVVQMFASVTGGPRLGDAGALFGGPEHGLSRPVSAQEDNEDDEDNDDDDEDDDNDDDEDDDNDDTDEDNDDDDSDNDEDDSDNDEDEDNEDEDDEDNEDEDDDDVDDDVDEDDPFENADNVTPGSAVDALPTPTTAPVAPAASPAAVASPVASPIPVTEVQGVTSGMDMSLALSGDRVTVQVFASMPAGITLKLKMVDPLTYPATPGIRAGDLIFQLEATDATGAVLTTLPGEVNLSVKYTEIDVTGLDDTNVTMARLDPVDNQWKTAPKLLTDPATNFVAASIMDTGVYAVYVP